MKVQNSLYRFLTALFILALVMPGVQAAPVTVTTAGPSAHRWQQPAGPDSGLYRTQVTLRNPSDRKRLDAEGIVVLDATPDTALVLADDEQLETLARLRLQPADTGEVGGLLRAQGPEKAWLAASLAPLVAQGVALQVLVTGKTASTEAVAGARAALRTTLQALTSEQRAGLAAASSDDEDGDGLTNTEEAWWCTDPLNANSDGDANGYTDGQEVAALLDFTLSRTVRWGYGPPFGPPAAWPNFNNRDGTGVKVCNDGDKDTIPDYAEVYMVGTRVPEESTDHDKFDDGQELFGTTFCPGDAPNPCWGILPAGEYWNFIQVSMPNWVLPPGDNPLVAAFPVPEVYVTPGSWHVERVTTITTSQGEVTEISNNYQTSVMRGQGSSIANTVTWNNWEEVSQAVETPLPTAAGAQPQWVAPLLFQVARVFGPRVALGVLGRQIGGFLVKQGLSGVLKTIGTGVATSLIADTLKGAFSGDDKKDDIEINSTIQNVNVNNVSSSAEANASVTLNQNFDFQGVVNSLDGVQYAINQQGALLARGLYDISYAISQPRYTETRTNGHSWGGAQTTTQEEYEEHSISEGQAFTTGQNWSTAWAVDSSHAADLTFEFTVKNTGTEYARELSGIVVNLYIGDDTSPSVSYPAWEKFPNGKLENLFPVGPNTPPGQFSERTFTTNPIALTLEQMKRIDLGERLTVKVESYSYGADELFYTNAVTGGVTVFIEDGVEDGDETVDSYVIPTWGIESVQDVLTRYFRCPSGQTCTDADGNLNALWTPEYDGVNPPAWQEHYLSDIAWWNVYLTQPDAGDTSLQDLPAQAGSGILFRFNRDSDRDGYNDRAEFRYYCALPAGDPDHVHCADAYLRPEVHPQPEVSAGYVTERSGNVVTVKLAVENTGTFDAYGIDAVMYSPDGTTTIGNNTVGGNGRVRPGNHVAVGSLIKPPDLAAWGASTAKPYAGGQFSGAADRTFTFTAATPGVVGQGATAMTWSDGAGGSGPINLGSSYHAPLPVDVAQGLQIGLNTGTIAAGARFTVPALTSRDTFTYTVVSEPFTPPVIAISYSDPQGSHRFVTPVVLPSLDASIAAGQMLEGLQVEVVTPAAFNAAGANTTHLVVNNPHPATIQGGHLYLNFVSDGVLVLEKSYTLDILAGPTVFPADWSVTEFSADYHPEGDNLLIAFWTDSEGNIIDSAARPFNSFAADPKPAFAMTGADATWDFGAAAQGTILKRSFTFANTGALDLLTYVSAPVGLTVSQTGSRRVGLADMTTYDMALNTANLSVGPYTGDITIRTSDPANPTRTVQVTGTVTAAPCDGFIGTYYGTQDLTGVPLLTRCDELLNFDWGGGSPSATIPVDHFSARWTKQIQVPVADIYTFDVRSDDGVRIYVDEQLVVDAWRDQGFLYASGNRNLSVGMHTIRVDWYENAGDAAIRLVYGPSGTRMYPLDVAASVSGTQGQWVEFTHTLGPEPQTLHPVKVYSQDYSTLKGVGKYATPFGSGTASYDMFGDGRDGVMPSGGNLDNNNGVGVGIVNSGSAGTYSVNVTDAYAGSRINPGDAVLIHQTQGTGAGCWELNKAVSDYTGGTAVIQLAKPLQCNYASGGNNHAQIQRVPQYSSCNVTSTVTPLYAWNGSSGGILAVMCRDSMTVTGAINASGAGYRGGQTGTLIENSWSYAGEGFAAPSIKQRTANGNGGGGGKHKIGRTGGGGGAGSLYVGTNGWQTSEGNDNGYGGNSVGDPELMIAVLGGGGGGGGHSDGPEVGGVGGNGGGLILLYTGQLSVPGLLAANGANGTNAAAGQFGDAGGGGGGAGGAIRVVARVADVGSSRMQVSGGEGGTSPGFGGRGGGGSIGRIRVEYCESLTGSTNPPASTQQLNCYIAEQIESAPYTTTRLNLPESGTHTYQVLYGRRLVFGGDNQITPYLRVPAGLFTSVTLQALVSDLSANASFSLDVGNTGSDSWNGTVANAGEYTSPNLAGYFNAYWASHGAPINTGYLDVPVRVTLDRAGQVLLTNLQVTPTGSKTRALRLPVRPQGYSSVTTSFTVSGGTGPLAVGVDVGDNGSVDWAYTGSPTYPANLTTGNLATAVNAYLAGHSGEVDVPLRFYLAPFATLNLADFSAAPVGQPDAQIGANDITFNAAMPVETDPVTVIATLHNPSGLDSGGLTAVFYGTLPAGQPQGLPLQIGAAYVPNIPANGTATASIPWDTTGFTGTVPVRAVIDPFNRVAETNETNNEATANLTILTRPDLQTTQMALSNPEPVTDELVSITLSVHNAGQTAAGAQTIALYDGNPEGGGALIAAQNLASLAGGTTVNMIFPWTPTTASLHRLFARLDRDGQVNESDEGNNQSWRDVYVGFAGPLLLDSGNASADPGYDPATGFGVVDEGQPDVMATCGAGAAPEETLRRDPDGRVVYRFDHLLPGHFYHLDTTLYECDGAQRQESIRADGNLIAGPTPLGDGEPHRFSLHLDPALYANRTISVSVEAPGINGAIANQVNLHDVDYRYSDSGAASDLAYSPARGYGWLDGVANVSWGRLPYQSVRVDQTDATVRYQFDHLAAGRRYQVNLTLYQGDTTNVTEEVLLNGLSTGVIVNLSDRQPHYLVLDVPVEHYRNDGSLIVSVRRTNGTTGAFVNEISLEQKTLLTLPAITDVRVSNVSDNSATLTWITDKAASGEVHFGASSGLGRIAHDDRGVSTSSRTHHVTLSSLAPSTTYFFYVTSADTVDDNGGAFYQFATGPTLTPPAPDLIYGQVFLPDGVTPAAGAMLYATLHDGNGQGSPGDAALLSYVIRSDDDGYWNVNLGNARTTDLAQPFQYSPAGDQVRLYATDGSGCEAEQVVDTANDTPALPMTLTCPTQVTHNLAIGWNLLGLNVLADPMPLAEEALDDIEAQGGNASEIDRWLNGGWNSHIHNLPFNNYQLDLGAGYFVKSAAVYAWQRSGRPPSNPLPVVLTPGWNLIGLPRLPGLLTAEQLLDGIEAQGGNCSEIDRWLNGGWNGHIHNLPFNNFTLRTDEGYFVKCSQASTYIPPLLEQVDADAWPAPVAMAALKPVDNPSIGDVLVTNRRDVALTVTWRTDQPSDGWVEYGTTPGMGRVAYDDRGEKVVAAGHHVTLARLQPEATIFFRVHAGDTVLDQEGKPFATTTLVTTAPDEPVTVYGQVVQEYDALAPGAMVIARLMDSTGNQSEILSTLVDGWGYWVLSVPEVACEQAKLHLQIVEPTGKTIELNRPACQ